MTVDGEPVAQLGLLAPAGVLLAIFFTAAGDAASSGLSRKWFQTFSMAIWMPSSSSSPSSKAPSRIRSASV